MAAAGTDPVLPNNGPTLVWQHWQKTEREAQSEQLIQHDLNKYFNHVHWRDAALAFSIKKSDVQEKWFRYKNGSLTPSLVLHYSSILRISCWSQN